MIWTVETIQRAILQEARRRWSKTGEGHDKLAPSLAVSLLSESKWYVSLVRWPDRSRKIVERRCEGDDLLKALVTIATGFVPSSHPSWLDTAAQHAADPGKHARDLAWVEGLGAEANTMHLPIKIEIPPSTPAICGLMRSLEGARATGDNGQALPRFDSCGGSCGGADPDCDTCG